MEYEYWASFGREHQMTLPDVTVTIEVREAEHDPDAEALIVRELARIIHGDRDSAPGRRRRTRIRSRIAGSDRWAVP